MSDKIPLAGVIGSPIAHSKSPKLHGYWLSRYGLKGHYIPMDVAQADLKHVLETLPLAGFVGVNVTVPHKEAVLGLATVVTDRAALIGAANTLTFGKDGKIIADNTDGYGFIENLQQNAPSWDPADGPAAVLGAGGAARAVISALLDTGAPEGQAIAPVTWRISTVSNGERVSAPGPARSASVDEPSMFSAAPSSTPRQPVWRPDHGA